MEIGLRVGDRCNCPEDHEAKIVWISEDKKTVGVKCSQRHFSKVTKVADRSKSPLTLGRYPTKERKVFVRDMVFLVRL